MQSLEVEIGQGDNSFLEFCSVTPRKAHSSIIFDKWQYFSKYFSIIDKPGSLCS
jgi:hypothetical protein